MKYLIRKLEKLYERKAIFLRQPFISKSFIYFYDGWCLDFRTFKLKKCKPNFLIIGAQKAGTTSLHNYLYFHPDIFMSKMKEPGYFLNSSDNKLREEYNSSNEIRLGLSDNHLLKWMLRGYRGQKLIGESSTHYTKMPEHGFEVPYKCKRINSDMKFIYMIRNPFDRIVSQYLHSLRANYTNNNFNDVIRDDELYLSFSLYYFQLRNYLKYFHKDNFKVIIFEEFINEPYQSLSKLYEFLNIDNSSTNELQFAIYNKSVNRENISPAKLKFSKDNYRKMRSFIEDDILKMEEFLRRSLDIWDISESKWC